MWAKLYIHGLHSTTTDEDESWSAMDQTGVEHLHPGHTSFVCLNVKFLQFHISDKWHAIHCPMVRNLRSVIMSWLCKITVYSFAFCVMCSLISRKQRVETESYFYGEKFDDVFCCLCKSLTVGFWCAINNPILLNHSKQMFHVKELHTTLDQPTNTVFISICFNKNVILVFKISIFSM